MNCVDTYTAVDVEAEKADLPPEIEEVPVLVGWAVVLEDDLVPEIEIPSVDVMVQDPENVVVVKAKSEGQKT